jgi:hypothetical protein
MKRLVVVLTAVVTFTLAGAGMILAADTLPKPEALSEETIYLTEKLSSNYDTLVIRQFTADKAEYSRVDDEERGVIEKMKPNLVRTISDTLEAELKAKNIFKRIVKDGKPAGKAVILEGELTEFNAGSKALKFFVGFGAGKAYLKSKGRLLDAATGKELVVFEDRETGYLGSMSMMSYDDLFPHQAKGMGENLAKFLEKLY